MIRNFPFLRRVFLPRHFIASGLLLFVLVSLYAFFEAQRLQQVLLRQTENKGTVLAKAMESSVRNSIVSNTALVELIRQRLGDNARLIDKLLLSRQVDTALLKEISMMNRLQKIDLLDEQGRPWKLAALSTAVGSKRVKKETVEPESQMTSFAWGKLWRLPTEKPKATRTTGELPPIVKNNEFWKGSAFGIAVGARSFPGIIAIHANADYIFNFEKAIGVQSQIEDLGRQSDSEFVAFLDSNLNIVAHTDRRQIGQQEKEPLVLKAKVDHQLFSQIVDINGGKRYLEVVQPVTLDESNMGFLKLGLSLGSMDVAWRNSVQAIVFLGVALLGAGILGMAAIFQNQQTHTLQVKSLEAEVLQKERLSALGNMAAAVAHEVRNPLNAISMGLQRLSEEFTPTDNSEGYSRLTKLMLGETYRLNSIVDQFLSLARPIEIKAEAVPIREVLKELASLQASDAKQANVQIRVSAASDLPALEVDPGYFSQVLLNLMLNGLQAMPEGGILTLDAKIVNRKFLIGVTDTGTGIAAENQRQIFTPYFTTKVKGSGLGLAISRRIIEAHGGTLTAFNQPAGGCRFEISLPLSGVEV